MAPLGARGSKPTAGVGRAQREAEVRGRQPRLPSRAAEVSEVHKIDTPRYAPEGVRACICFQHSAYTARSGTLHPALHSAQHLTVPSATLHR